jgi:hypothetical protein
MDESAPRETFPLRIRIFAERTGLLTNGFPELPRHRRRAARGPRLGCLGNTRSIRSPRTSPPTAALRGGGTVCRLLYRGAAAGARPPAPQRSQSGLLFLSSSRQACLLLRWIEAAIPVEWHGRVAGAGDFEQAESLGKPSPGLPLCKGSACASVCRAWCAGTVCSLEVSSPGHPGSHHHADTGKVACAPNLTAGPARVTTGANKSGHAERSRLPREMCHGRNCPDSSG